MDICDAGMQMDIVDDAMVGEVEDFTEQDEQTMKENAEIIRLHNRRERNGEQVDDITPIFKEQFRLIEKKYGPAGGEEKTVTSESSQAMCIQRWLVSSKHKIGQGLTISFTQKFRV